MNFYLVLFFAVVWSRIEAGAAAVAGRGGRRAGRSGGEEAQPALRGPRVPQRPGGSRPGSPQARGRCGGRPPEGGSRQGAAPRCLSAGRCAPRGAVGGTSARSSEA